MISYAFDIGTRSIGAVVFKQCAEGDRLLWSGVTIFGAPKRQRELLRTAIRTRKRRFRRKERLLKLRKWLEKQGLLPEFSETRKRNEIFSWDPRELYEQGLTRQLTEFEMGRVLYYFGKHRGENKKGHEACRNFKNQIQRLQRLWDAQTRFGFAFPNTQITWKDISTLVFLKAPNKSWGRAPIEIGLYRAQPLAELAMAAQNVLSINYIDRVSSQQMPLNSEIRSNLIAQLMLGKTIDQDVVAKQLNLPQHAILWPQNLPSKIFLKTTHQLVKTGHFGHHWNRLSINQQDYLITAIIERDQAKLIEFWPNDLHFSPERLDRLLRLPFSKRRVAFGSTKAGEIIQNALSNTPQCARRKNNRKKKSLFDQVFRRLLQKMSKKFSKPGQVLIEFPDRADKTTQKNLRRQLFEAHFDKKMNGFICPYTGTLITKNMFQSHAVEIDHLIPKSHGGSDALENLTLCAAHANRAKADRTPFEAFGQQSDWKTMCARIKNWPLEKQLHFKSQAKRHLYQRALNQSSLDETSRLARIAKEMCLTKFNGAQVDFVSSQDVQKFGQTVGLKKNRNDIRHHSIDAGLVYLFHRKKPELTQTVMTQIIADTRPIFVSTEIASGAKTGALSHYHSQLEIKKCSGAATWQMACTQGRSSQAKRRCEPHLIMRVKKGDVLHLPYHRNKQKFLRVFRLQPSNGTIALGAPYLAGKEGETPLIYKSASQLQKLGATKCRQIPLGYSFPA